MYDVVILLLAVVMACGCGSHEPIVGPVSVPLENVEEVVGMFGYLNLNNPTAIKPNEAQESLNCRIDKGYLEFQRWAIDSTINRAITDLAGRSVFIDSSAIPFPTFPGIGYLHRLLSTGVSDRVGTEPPAKVGAWNPGSAGTNHPQITAAAYGSQPYPVGTYNYVITLYNPTTGEESVPYSFTQAIGANEVAQFQNFPAAGTTAYFDKKTAVEWRIYRMPLGGSEYLRTLESSTIQAYTANATVYQDITADVDLGGANDSSENYTPDSLTAGAFEVVVEHNGKLFFNQVNKIPGGTPLLADGHAVYFSRTGDFGAIAPTNYLGFSSIITGLHTINEALVILCQDDIFILYGMDENDFQQKNVNTAKIGNAYRYSSAVVGEKLVFLGNDKTTNGDGNGIFVLTGNGTVRVSFSIDTMFPVLTFDPSSGSTYDHYQVGRLEDRFFVLLHGGKTGLIKTFLVYDVVGNGFTTGNEAGTIFSYRTKEFSRPARAGYVKTCWVEYEGDITATIYKDNIAGTPVSLSSTTRIREWFNADPYRFDTFSFRFTGDSTAKIYGYGVSDPPIEVGK